MLRFHIELEHMTSGVPLTGKITMSEQFGSDFRRLNVTKFSMGRDNISFTPATGYSSIMPIQEKTFSQIRDYIRGIYDTINFKWEHYLWINDEKK